MLIPFVMCILVAIPIGILMVAAQQMKKEKFVHPFSSRSSNCTL